VISSDRFIDYISTKSAMPPILSLARLMEAELNKEEQYDLIEDYIFNQDNYMNEGSGGFKIKPLEDPNIQGLFKINDFLWIKNKEKLKFVVALSRIPSKYQSTSPLDEHGEFLLNVYEGEKMIHTLKSRSEIISICVDNEEAPNIVYGGLQNGRIAIWDISGKRRRPETLSRPHLNSNYLSIVHIGGCVKFLIIIRESRGVPILSRGRRQSLQMGLQETG
jgi:hypothetical protein